MARSTDRDTSRDVGWTTWRDPAGNSGTKTVEFTTGEKDNYYLIWGIHYGGALSIDNIKLEIVPYQYDKIGRLIRYYAANLRIIYYHYDPTGN